MSFDNFFAAVERLAPTRKQQAQALGMTPRGFEKLRKGPIPRWLVVLVTNPELLDALARDAQSRSQASIKTS